VKTIKWLVSLALLLIVAGTAQAGDIRTLTQAGVRFRLQGDYDGAYRIAERLKLAAPGTSHGAAFHLQTLIARLSWDEEITDYDQAIRDHANGIIETCKASRDLNATIGYHCGVAYFALSYLNAIRGKYFQAAGQATSTIRYLERALEKDPDRVEAKLPLALTYYYASNLPPFLRALATFLWFLPSGDEAVALRYLHELSALDSPLGYSARFMLADLLATGDPEDQRLATKYFREVVERYPGNIRLQLAYVTHLILIDCHEAAGTAIEAFQDHAWSSRERTLMAIWQARYHLETGNFVSALSAWRVVQTYQGTLPSWSRPWLALNEAQVLALKGHREQAAEAFDTAIALNDRYPSKKLRRMAEDGRRAVLGGQAIGPRFFQSDQHAAGDCVAAR